MRTLYLIALLFFIPTVNAASAKDSSAIDSLVKDLCKKEVVMLGEDMSHSSGQALLLRTDITRKLIDQCQFKGVFFEAQTYDFIDYHQKLEKNEASKHQLYNALGAFISTTKESAALVDLLYEKTQDHSILVGGVDVQAQGAMNEYAHKALPIHLTELLHGERKEECRTALVVHQSWMYSEEHPYTANTEPTLHSCVEEIYSASLQHPNSTSRYLAERLHRAYSLDENNYVNDRDQAMFESFQWLKNQLPKQAKVIVWMANMHVAKENPYQQPIFSTGRYVAKEYGDNLSSIAITAYQATLSDIGGNPMEIGEAKSDSLEAKAVKNKKELVYFNHERLKKLGNIDARIVSYQKPFNADWSKYFDGVLIVEKDTPLTRIRKPKPMKPL